MKASAAIRFKSVEGLQLSSFLGPPDPGLLPFQPYDDNCFLYGLQPFVVVCLPCSAMYCILLVKSEAPDNA